MKRPVRHLAIAADHAGRPLKRALLARLAVIAPTWTPLDLDPVSAAADDDYPDAAARVARALRSGRADRGLLLCGSGIGVAIAANKFTGVRAAPVHDSDAARAGVVDDALNVLALGGRRIAPAAAAKVLAAFLAATPSRALRHRRRRAKIARIEAKERKLTPVSGRTGRR